MSKAIKFKNNMYLDTRGAVHNGTILKTYLDNEKTRVDGKQNIIYTQRVNITTRYNCIFVYRYGNVVSVDIDGYIQESGGNIATNLPKAVALAYIRSLNVSEYLRVDGSGNLLISGHTAGEWVNFHGTYITS